MKPKIKICGLNNPENIKSVLSLQPDFIGFIFYKGSPRCVTNALPAEEIKMIEASVNKVGVFVNANDKEIFEAAENFDLNYLQLHGEETPAQCFNLRKKIKVIKAFKIYDENSFAKVNKYTDVCDYFLFDTGSKKYGGSGKKFNYSLLENYKGSVPYFLAGGIQPMDKKEQLRHGDAQLYAYDLNSCFEETPGIKNVQLLKQFINENNLQK